MGEALGVIFGIFVIAFLLGFAFGHFCINSESPDYFEWENEND